MQFPFRERFGALARYDLAVRNHPISLRLATVKGKLDPSQHAKGWRSAWRSMRRKAATRDEGEVIYPNLLTVRFHDLRHTAITVMAEAGLPHQTIMAQVGHLSPEMIKHYSHIRRQSA